MKFEKEVYGNLDDGREVYLFTLKQNDGTELKLTNFGATVVSLQVPDRNGNVEHVILGFKKLKEYESIRHFYGAIVGRWGNRIDKGKFTLNGKEYTLAINDGDNHLHGGLKGFDRILWDYELLSYKNQPAVKFTYLSKDGEEGYPGNLRATVTYKLSDENVLTVEYHTTSDKATPINLTQHTYFNLKGEGEGTILDHQLMIRAQHYTPIDEGFIPTGEIASVIGTPFDFTKPKPIGRDIGQDHEQLRFGLGYDHNFVLEGEKGAMKLAARVCW